MTGDHFAEWSDESSRIAYGMEVAEILDYDMWSRNHDEGR